MMQMWQQSEALRPSFAVIYRTMSTLLEAMDETSL